MYTWLTYIVLIGSVSPDENMRNCFPFFVYPLTSVPKATKILSGDAPEKTIYSKSYTISIAGDNENTEIEK